MATIKDIAKLAGVSHGTVSNVLNRKGIVSSEKMARVEEAIRRLGYNPHAQARILRKESNRHLALILPNIREQGNEVFYTGLKSFAEDNDYGTSLFLTNNSPEKEEECLRAALAIRPEFIVFFSCTGKKREYPEQGVKIIYLNSPGIVPSKDQASVFFDYKTAADDFAKAIIQEGWQKIAFFADSAALPSNRIFFESLRRRLSRRSIKMIPFYYDFRQIYHGAIAILESPRPFDMVISNNPRYIEKLRQVQEMLGYKPVKMMSFAQSETMPLMDWPHYAFDYRELARLAFSVIGDFKKYEGKSIPLKGKGFFSPWETIAFTGKSRDIDLLTIESPTAKILSTLIPLLKRNTGIRLKLTVLPYEDAFKLISRQGAGNFDLMRIDMAWRKGFEKLHYLPLDPADADIASFLGTFLPSIKSVYCPDGSALYTLPFDPSIQMLFFRRDLFEDATIKRIYYEHNREDLKIPGNYDEYDHMTGFFASKLNADFPVECGATMVYGNEITAACEMLPRIKSMGGSIFDGAGRIDLLSPVFVGALEKYLTIRKYSTENVLNWWDDALNIFIQGRAAMTVIFINHVSRIIRTHDIDTSMRVGFAPVPGNYPLLGGGVIGMSKRSKKTACCIDFLKWLYSDGIANTITLLGGLSPCASVFSNEEILEIYPWLRNISEQFELGWRSSKSRLFPDFDNYKFEQIFGGAVRSAALGITGLREALESAQKECEKVFT